MARFVSIDDSLPPQWRYTALAVGRDFTSQGKEILFEKQKWEGKGNIVRIHRPRTPWGRTSMLLQLNWSCISKWIKMYPFDLLSHLARPDECFLTPTPWDRSIHTLLRSNPNCSTLFFMTCPPLNFLIANLAHCTPTFWPSMNYDKNLCST
jgi:hypothetical protein